ncbi:flagellin N-terminal helical domain-containing protein, partial [Bathymodiolus platifrons methanotrophic gill symbiont]|uniref:flagellin N-terminal helical domain-containing protein n=1 Tax=Bathymodiolus platifrons methanotrophic gill symbiont TaxID=113268 RepID=UPI002452E6E1
MSFTLATNVTALNAANNTSITQKSIQSSLEKLSSGYKINKAADDAAGMAIADVLRTQARSLGQAIRNANDAIGIIQIADKAMDEQVKILDTIKVKAIQAAQDGQTTQTRSALQSDITRLLEELDNISSTTTFNGKSLLAGGFSNAKFQIGAYSNTVITASITATSSDKIGQTRFETGKTITSEGVTSLTFKAVNGRDDITIESAIISHGVGTGIGALSEVINKNSNELQVRASWSVESTGSVPIGTGATDDNHTVKGLVINGVKIGSINNIKINDSDGNIAASINNSKSQTG